MRKFFSAALAVVIGLSSASIYAADDKPKTKPDPEARFKKLDKDKDGKLTKEEFIGKRSGEAKEKAEKAFATKDKDKDGKLTLEEFKGKGKGKKS